MIQIAAVFIQIPDLDENRIADWIARGWVQAEGQTRRDWSFTEPAVARLHLLHDLQLDLALDDQAVPVVVALLDQIHALRQTLRTIGELVQQTPDIALKTQIVAALVQQGRS